MNKKIDALIAIGGTGGHVFPGLNLAKHLKGKNYNVKLTSDVRGFKFLKNFYENKIYLIPSTPLIKKNIFSFILSTIYILYSIIRSLIFLLLNRPKIVFGMGGYASFPICLAAIILRIKFIIYENNLIIGKTNRILIPYTNKIFVAYKDLEGVPEKYKNKIFEIGNIIKKEIINFSKSEKKTEFQEINLLILGGSQAAKIFGEVLPNIFKECAIKGIPIKIYQHCLPEQNKFLKSFYKDSNLKFELFNFSNNIEYYFSKVNLAITRSGSSMLAELTNANIPFISVPLPSSADNHQLKNAVYYQKKNFSFLIEEKDLKDKLFSLIQDINVNKYKLEKIKINQSQYSDRNVYENIDNVLIKFANEKN